jgi:preprotein translocase subunit SecE
MSVRAPMTRERTMADRFNPIAFLQQVRAETAKVVWPSRRETAISTGMVVVMAIVASIFFLLTDLVMSRGVALLLGIGSSS